VNKRRKTEKKKKKKKKEAEDAERKLRDQEREETRRREMEELRRQAAEEQKEKEERKKNQLSPPPVVNQPSPQASPQVARSSPYAGRGSPGMSPKPDRPPQRDECNVCYGRVYLTEKLEIDKKLFHKNCFKCSHCGKILSAGTYASMEGVVYCKPHFIHLFKEKGNYNEGFGKKRLAHEWAEKSGVDLTSTIPGTVGGDDNIAND